MHVVLICFVSNRLAVVTWTESYIPLSLLLTVVTHSTWTQIEYPHFLSHSFNDHHKIHPSNVGYSIPVAARSIAWVCGRSLAGIASGERMSVCALLSGRGLFDGPIARPEESYRVRCVWSRNVNGSNLARAVAPWEERLVSITCTVLNIHGPLLWIQLFHLFILYANVGRTGIISVTGYTATAQLLCYWASVLKECGNVACSCVC
jgi:hypothetical protein